MIATVNDIKTKGRYISKHIDDAVVLPFIRESEMREIRLAIGDALYLSLDAYIADTRIPVNAIYDNLLDGCTWEKCGQKYILVGLIEIICYLTQARLAKSGDIHVTRSGNKMKLDESSETPEIKERIVFYKELFIIAEEYLKSVVEYIENNLSNACRSTAKRYHKSVTIQAIGD